jgi:hypothetical protein
VVYSCTVCVLATTDDGHPYRGAQKGPLADAISSYRDNDVDLHQLWISPNKGCKPGSLRYGRCGSISARKVPLFITLAVCLSL